MKNKEKILIGYIGLEVYRYNIGLKVSFKCLVCGNLNDLVRRFRLRNYLNRVGLWLCFSGGSICLLIELVYCG